jgi:putative oxidoreductase
MEEGRMTDTPYKTETKSAMDWLYLADPIAQSSRDITLLFARFGIGIIFLMSGWRKLFDMASVAASFPARGIPAELGYIAPIVEFGGGLFLILGLATRYSAIVMLIFTIVATFTSHRYWTFTEPAVIAAQSSNFWKNVAIKGGIIALFVAGPGRISLDGIFGRGRH